MAIRLKAPPETPQRLRDPKSDVRQLDSTRPVLIAGLSAVMLAGARLGVRNPAAQDSATRGLCKFKK
jgi:hypothetical protein